MKTLWHQFKYTVQEDMQQLFKPTEKNPVDALQHYMNDAKKETKKVETLLERHRILKQELHQQRTQAHDMLEKRRVQLTIAKQTEENDLIDFATKEVAFYEKHVQSITTSLNEVTEELVTLEHKFEDMLHRLKEMAIQQLVVMGKENSKRAHAQMDQVLGTRQQNDNNVVTEAQQYIEEVDAHTVDAMPASTMEDRLNALPTHENTEQIM